MELEAYVELTNLMQVSLVHLFTILSFKVNSFMYNKARFAKIYFLYSLCKIYYVYLEKVRFSTFEEFRLYNNLNCLNVDIDTITG